MNSWLFYLLAFVGMLCFWGFIGLTIWGIKSFNEWIRRPPKAKPKPEDAKEVREDADVKAKPSSGVLREAEGDVPDLRP